MPRNVEESAAVFVPRAGSLDDHRAAAAECRGCPLFQLFTQTAFGEGTPRAVIVSYHPSAVLRAPDEAARARFFELLVEDLRAAREQLKPRIGQRE